MQAEAPDNLLGTSKCTHCEGKSSSSTKDIEIREQLNSDSAMAKDIIQVESPQMQYSQNTSKSKGRFIFVCMIIIALNMAQLHE